MPQLQTHHELTNRLRTVLAARTHWIFAGEGEAALVLLEMIVVGIRARGLLAAEIDTATAKWIEGTTGAMYDVAFMVVSKSRLLRPDVEDLCRLLGHPLRTPEEDIVVVGEKPELVGALILQIEQGVTFPGGEMSNN